MAREFGNAIHQLPLIPANVLKKRRVHEPLDTRFRSAASFWRENRDLAHRQLCQRRRQALQARKPYLGSGPRLGLTDPAVARASWS